MRVDVVLRGMTFQDMQKVVGLGSPRTFWLPESPGDRPASLVAAGLLGGGDGFRLATGVTPVPFRKTIDHVASYLALAEAFPGRFDFGIGSGNAKTLARVGIAPKPALGVVRGLAEALQAARSGTAMQVPLDMPPPSVSAPFFIAAHNRKMIDLACEVADGVLLNVVPASDIEPTLAFVRDRIARHGRDVRIALFQTVALGRTAGGGVDAARQVLGGFLKSPVVQNRLASFGSEYAGRTDLSTAGVRDFAATDVDELDERLALLASSGVDIVGLSVFPAPLVLRKEFPPVPMGDDAIRVTTELLMHLDASV